MAIEISCECGKRLRAKEEWSGTRVKCPACGQVLTVPGARPARPAMAGPAVAKKTAGKESDRREDAFDDFEPSRPRKKKKKKSKGGGAGFSFPEFDFLGIHMTLRKWIALACVATILGLGIYFFWPRASVAVLDARWVDAYAALE